MPASPCTHTSSGAVQRSPAPAAMSSLIAAVTKAPPAHSSLITPAMMTLSSRRACTVSRPPTFISTSSATTERPSPVRSSSIPSTATTSRPATTSRLLVGQPDLGALERAGAHGAARGVVEHRLGAELERVRSFHPVGGGEGPVVRGRLRLGRIEHREQRRPGRDVDAEVLGARAGAHRAPVAVGKFVRVVAERVLEVDQGRVAPRAPLRAGRRRVGQGLARGARLIRIRHRSRPRHSSRGSTRRSRRAADSCQARVRAPDVVRHGRIVSGRFVRRPAPVAETVLPHHHAGPPRRPVQGRKLQICRSPAVPQLREGAALSMRTTAADPLPPPRRRRRDCPRPGGWTRGTRRRAQCFRLRV